MLKEECKYCKYFYRACGIEMCFEEDEAIENIDSCDNFVDMEDFEDEEL